VLSRDTREIVPLLSYHYCTDTDTAIAIALAASRCDGYGVVVGVDPFRSDIGTVRQYCAVPYYHTISNSFSCFFFSFVMLYFMSLDITVNESFESSSYFSSLSSPLVWPSCGRGRMFMDVVIILLIHVNNNTMVRSFILFRSFLLRIILFFN